jgi:MATE family multidrug resistance protein
MTSGKHHTVRAEIRDTIVLAGPVVLGQIGVMLMNVVDTMMVGPLGKVAVAAVGVGASIFSAVYVAGFGMLLGLDRLVSVAYGAGRKDECQRAMVQGLFLATAVALPLTGLLLVVANQLPLFKVVPEIVPEAAAYLRVLAWSLWPALLFAVLRSTLQATGDVRFASSVLLAANVVNAVANKLLIFGLLGFPALGVAGSAWATLISRMGMLLAIAWYMSRQRLSEEPTRWALDGRMMKSLLRLGIPASAQLSFEVGVFSLSTILVAGLNATAAAAHQIVLQIASFTFMVPLGLASAGAVRVGQAIGRGDLPAAKRAGWCSVGIGVAFMTFSAVVLLAGARPILGLFKADESTMALATKLLLCAAVFQFVDGAQVTLAGALRGLGNTIASMVANGIGHWGIGLPIGYVLAFRAGLGALGIWIGLAAGLAAVAVALLIVWRRGIARASLEHHAPATA